MAATPTVAKELQNANEKLNLAETELTDAKAELKVVKAETQSSPERIAKAELGVAEAKLGVAEAKFERADSTDKEAYKSAWLTAQEAHRAAAAAAQAAAKAYESAVEKGSKQDASKAETGELQEMMKALSVHIQELVREQSVQQSVHIQELVREQSVHSQELLNRLFPGGSTSSPTPATVGKQQYSDLQVMKQWNRVTGSGPPAVQEMNFENMKKEGESEDLVIRLFTPHLQRLVALASEKAGLPLLLVNSERHCWVQDTLLGGAATAPDQFVTHPAFFESCVTQGDEKLDGTDFLFGKPAHWDLRDSIEVIIEWKVKITEGSFSPLGECVEYARRLNHVPSSSVTLDMPRVRCARFMLADPNSFYLLQISCGNCISCLYGKWTDPGSQDAIVSFISDGVGERRWIDAITCLCSTLKVKLMMHSTNEPRLEEPCFLGRGANGRVFRVLSEDGKEVYGLKVALDDGKCGALEREFYKFKFNKAKLESLGCVASISAIHVDPDRKMAGLLVQPVGRKISKTKADIKAAISGLKLLAKGGFRHGDAREANVVFSPSTQGPLVATWLDLQTLSAVGDSDREKSAAFVADMITFAKSLRVGEDDLEECALEYFSKDNKASLNALAQKFVLPWQSA